MIRNLACLALITARAGTASPQPELSTARLLLEFREDGLATVHLSAAIVDLELSELGDALADSLSCEPVEVAARQSSEGSTVSGACPGALVRRGMTLEGSVSPSFVGQLLERQGVEKLFVRVEHPDASADACSGFQSGPGDHHRLYDLRDGHLESMTLEFGYDARERFVMFLPLASLVFLSLGSTWLWQFRARREMALVDDEAWFRHWQFLRLTKAGLFLLWPIAAAWALLRDPFQFLSNVDPPGLLAGVAVVFYLGAPSVVAAFSRGIFQPILAQQDPRRPARSQYFWGAVVEDASLLLPLGLALVGLAILRESPRAGGLLLVLTFLTRDALARGTRRLLVGVPTALREGDLTERTFRLAQRMAAPLRGLFVLTATTGQPPHAFVADRSVYLSTTVLELLDEKEVDATIAHELSHLKHHHGERFGLAIALAIGIVAVTIEAWPSSSLPFWAKPIIGTWLLGGLFLCYQFSRRRSEFLADREAVGATSDPAALIRGIVKLSRHGRIPLRFGRFDEATLSHPSVERRSAAIAMDAGLDASESGPTGIPDRRPR
jgi:Zn-dependent protease with chaperone function